MLQLYKLELAERMAGQVDTMEQLAQVKGARQMLRAIETLPVHVANRLDELKEEDLRIKEREDAKRRRTPF